MPSWVAPEDFVYQEIVRSSKLNRHLRDDVGWLKSRPFNSVMMSGVLVFTSTSFIEVTGTSISVTSIGGNMMIAACGVSDNSSTNTNTFDLAIDGVRQGDATTGLVAIRTSAATYADNVSMVFFTTTPPAAGAHLYSVHAKVSAGSANLLFRVFAIEIR